MERWIKPVILQEQHVRLEPLDRTHLQGLAQAAADGELWRLWYTSVPTPDQLETWLAQALAARDLGEMPFTVLDRQDQIVGTTRFCNVDEASQRLEIGYTWYARRVQRTAVNTECKFLLLQHAFEVLDAIAVEFRTHWCNHASRTAIARLGAKQDGILRSHKRLPDGSLRDTVVFSIIAPEWPTVRRHLQFKLEQGG